MLRPRTKPTNLITSINLTGFLSILIVLFSLLIVSGSPRCDLCRIAADLPHVSHPTALRNANREDAMTLTIMRDGKVFFRHDQVLADQLPFKIREAVQRGSEKKVYITADARARYGTVKQALDAIHDAGVENVAFLAEQRPLPAH